MNLHTPDAIGYINAGGRGTRLNSLFVPEHKNGIAKALLSIGNPETRLIDHHIANLRQQQIEKIVVAAGDQERVYEYVNDVYRDDGSVHVTKSTEQLGTGGDLLTYVRQNNTCENILVQNVDTVLDIHLGALLLEHRNKKKLGCVATIALTMNRGVPNEGAYKVSELGSVLYSEEFCDDEKEKIGSAVYQGSSTGAVAITPDFLRQNIWQPKDGQLSLYRHLLKDSWELKGLFAYNNGVNFFRDIGTVATWLASEDDIELQRHLRYNMPI